VLKQFGVRGQRRVRLLRMTEEAVDQDGVLTQEDLARLCQSDVRTIRRDLAGQTRGTHTLAGSGHEAGRPGWPSEVG